LPGRKSKGILRRNRKQKKADDMDEGGERPLKVGGKGGEGLALEMDLCSWEEKKSQKQLLRRGALLPGSKGERRFGTLWRRNRGSTKTNERGKKKKSFASGGGSFFWATVSKQEKKEE